MIEGSLSKLLQVHTGVPQGSILGPLFYTLFTNELPEVIHDLPLHVPDDGEEQGDQVWPAYHVEDEENGAICCYADDTTFSMSHSDPATLSAMLSEKYKLIAQFMVDNRLKLNDVKTHLLVLATPIQTQTRGAQVSISTPTETIRPTSSEKLLRCWINEDLKWTEHLRNNKDNLMKSLNTRLGAIKKINNLATFKNRKSIAEGIFMSKLSYLIALWAVRLCSRNLYR